MRLPARIAIVLVAVFVGALIISGPVAQRSRPLMVLLAHISLGVMSLKIMPLIS